MRRRPWGVVLVGLGGVALGVAVAGVPSRRHDPPLRVDAPTTTTTRPTVSTTATTTTTSTSSSSTTSTTRR